MRTGQILIAAIACTLFAPGCGDSGDEHENHSDHKRHEGAVAPVRGTSSPTASDPAILNTICPIQGEPIDPAITVDYEGKKVAFCCKECIPEWNKLTAAEKVANLK